MTAPGLHLLDLSAAIERADYWRRSPASVGGAAGHKEWSYFCVLGDTLQVVTAFSLMDRQSAASPGGIEEARVLLLVNDADGQWSGTVESCEPNRVAVEAGRVGARFGASELAFSAGEYRLRVATSEPAVDLTLALRPVARPAVTRSVPLGTADPMQWFVVPRLEAAGVVRVGSRVHSLHRCPAYHDHNWGRFAWGGDFAWEWGIVLGPAPLSWSMVFYRITDRGRHVVVSQGLLVWRDDRHVRTFRDGELDVRTSGILRTAHALRVPGIMRLAVPGSVGDIPRRLDVSARGGADALEFAVDVNDCAQICLPHDADDGITTISECPATANVAGRLSGSTVHFTSRAVLELNRAAT